MSPFPIASEAELQRARSGDRDAVARLWRVYQPQLLRFLRARGATDPDDVASQVWVDVGRSLRKFNGDGREFQRWIFTIARRRSIDAHRKQGRRREVPLAAHEPRADQPDFGVDESLANAIELLRTIPTNMADAIMLRAVYDLSISDVAAITEQSEANVRVLVHRGLKRLRDAMSLDELEIVRTAS